MQTKELHPVSPYRAAWDCLRFVAYFAAVLIAGGAAVGKLREEYYLIRTALNHAWEVVLRVLTVGGSFWGSVMVAGVAMVAVTWAWCVCHKVRTEQDTAKLHAACFISGLLGTVVWWILAEALLRMGAHTPYQNTALFMVWAGLGIHGFCIMWMIAKIVNQDDSDRGWLPADDQSVNNRLTFAASLKEWGLSQWECERVMAVFNTSGEVAAIRAARRYSQNLPN
jgi:hypothetical protein